VEVDKTYYIRFLLLDFVVLQDLVEDECLIDGVATTESSPGCPSGRVPRTVPDGNESDTAVITRVRGVVVLEEVHH
jgi:hypothetical protein